MNAPATASQRYVSRWGALGLLAVSLLFTILAWQQVASDDFKDAKKLFETRAENLADDISQRMTIYEQVLRGGKGLFEASNEVTRTEWKTYVEQLQLEKNFAGIQGFGYSERIPEAKLQAHLAHVRAEGFPNYKIRPEGLSGERHSIVYLEPFTERNQRAFGFDMYSEPVRRAAMERARDGNQTSLSGKVTLVQENTIEPQAGVLLYLPHYAKAKPLTTPEHRRQAFLGFIYAPFRMNDLMGNIMAGEEKTMRLEIFDGEKPAAEALLFDSARNASQALSAPPIFSKDIPIRVYGQTWLLHFTTLPGFAAQMDRRTPVIILLGGVVISFLIFAITLSFAATRQRAQDMAAELSQAFRAKEEQLRAIHDSTVDSILTISERGIIETVNPAVSNVFGWAAEEMIGRNVSMLMPEPYRSAHDGFLFNYLQTGEAKIIGIGREVPGQHKDGHIFPMELAVGELNQVGRKGFVGILRDISDRKEAQEGMMLANEQLSSSVEGLRKRDHELTLLNRMNDLLLACLDNGEAIQVLLLTAKEMFPGHSGALALLDKDEGILKSALVWGTALPQKESFSFEDCWALRQGRLHEIHQGQPGLICRHFSGEPATGHLCLPLMVQGSLIGLLTMENRETEQTARESHTKSVVAMGEAVKLALSNIELRNALREQAIRDPLTKLFNRRFLEETLEREIAQAERRSLPLALVIVDVDHFKRINDTFGHDAGDRVLVEMGALLKQHLRKTDFPCRFGGEEFVLVLPGASPDQALTCAEAIREKFKSLAIQHGGQSLGQQTLSAGLTIFRPGSTTQTLLKEADSAVYKAKQGGRDRVVTASELV
jgi:diguanylate cyclase (GGDEF)-like protein/PAS domain S-box-containing protein